MYKIKWNDSTAIPIVVRAAWAGEDFHEAEREIIKLGKKYPFNN